MRGASEGYLTSRDGGETWQALLAPIRPLAASAYCTAAGHCAAELFGYNWDAQYNPYVYKSFDAGQTWRCLEDPYFPPPPDLWLPLMR